MKVEILPSAINILKENYRVLVLPDLHIPIDMELKEIILNSPVFKEIDYVMLLGDNVACYGNDREYEFLNSFIKRMGKPYSAVNGNHEFMFEVIEFESENYGKIWKPNDSAGRKVQIEKFYNFFALKDRYWCERVNDILYLFLTIGRPESEKIEVLPDGCEEFLKELYKREKDVKYFFIFCHAPLKGSEIEGFKYYADDADPFVHLSEDIKNEIENSGIPTYWFSGHIHLNYNHPMSVIRRVNKTLYQVNCPPSWKFSRRDISDIVPKRHPEFSSLIVEKSEKITLKIFEWIEGRYIKEIEI